MDKEKPLELRKDSLYAAIQGGDLIVIERLNRISNNWERIYLTKEELKKISELSEGI